jgi:hypothetical protein
MKAGTESKLKFAGLKRQLRLPFWQVVGVLEALWHTTLRNAPDGDIGKLSNEDIASAIEWDGDADELIAALVKSRWLDTDPDYRLIVHDWSDHCPNYLKGGYTNGHKKFADVAAKERAKPPSLDTQLSSPAKLPSQDGASEGVATNSIQFNPSQCNPSQAKVCNAAAKQPTLPAAPPFDPSSVVFPVFPCVLGKKNGAQTWEVTKTFIAELAAAFPAVDVSTQARAAHVWVMSNLSKRKTAEGMRDFLFGWMRREQNKGGNGHSGNQQKQTPKKNYLA